MRVAHVLTHEKILDLAAKKWALAQLDSIQMLAWQCSQMCSATMHLQSAKMSQQSAFFVKKMTISNKQTEWPA